MSLKIYVKGNYFYIIDTSDNNKIYEAFAKDAKIRRLNEASTDFYVTNVNGFREDRKVPYSEILNEAGGTYTDIDAFITFYEDNTGKSSGGASPIPTETSEAINSLESDVEALETKLIDQALYANTKVVAFGDSITYLPSSWVTTFKELVGVQYIDNYAISGQKIAWKAGTVETSNPPNNGHDNNVLWNSIKKWELTTPESPDAIIIALGTNDISQGSILGDFTNAFAQDEPITTQLTMANAYRKAIHYLLTNYPNTQIFYCTPLQSKTGGRNYNTISNVGNILIDVSKRYGVKVIDVTNECGITQEFENEGVAGRYLYDGTHPTSPVSAAGSEVGVEFGSVMQGNYIANQFKKQFIV